MAPGFDVPLEKATTHGSRDYWRCPCCDKRYMSWFGGTVGEIEE